MKSYETNHSDAEPSPEAIAMMLELACWRDDMLIPLPVAA